MVSSIGVVCGECDAYSPLGTATCATCGASLALGSTTRSAPPAPVPPATAPPPPTTARKRPSVSAATARAIHAQDDESAVSSSGAFNDKASTLVPVAEMRTEPPSAELTDLDLEEDVPQRDTLLEDPMDQAKNFVCRSCSTPVPMGHKFCGRCGASVPAEILSARTQFFGQLQVPGKAKLILIRGEGVEGLSYQLNADQHILGRNGQLVFPDDPFISPKHANLFYRAGKLVVRDEGSLNGVYVRVRGTLEITPQDHFLAGEQLFLFEGTPRASDGPAQDGTYFYSSPKHQSPFRVTQVLQGGAAGITVCARGTSLQIGREGGDLNFPTDVYMSASHCKIDEAGGKFQLTDMNSRNGTYLRIKAERELSHGDYLFVGRKLLRVEITAA